MQNPVDYFNKRARAYASSEQIMKLQAKLTKKAVKLAGWDKGSKILDLGCGAGFGMQILKEEGYNVIGIDISDEMVKMAKERGFDARLADARDLPFKDKCFDGILSISTLQWLDKKDLQKVACEIHRVLKPNGIAVLQFYPLNQKDISLVGKEFIKTGFSGEFDIPDPKNTKKVGVYLVLKKVQP